MKTRRYPTRRCLNKIGDIKIFLSFLHPPPPPFLLQNPNTRGRHYIHTNIHIHIYIYVLYLILAERPLSYVPYTNIQPSIYREHGGVKIKRGEEERKKKKKKKSETEDRVFAWWRKISPKLMPRIIDEEGWTRA